MRFFHRLSLFVLTLLFLFLTFVLGIYAFGWLPESYFPALLTSMYGDYRVGLMAAIFFLLAVWLLQSFITENQQEQTIIQENEMGQVRIVSSAVKGLVRQVVLDQPGIADVKPSFTLKGEAFKIHLKLAVSEEAHIPTLSTEMEELVKERLMKMAGLQVDEVLVTVEEVEENKKRVSSTVRVR